MDSTKVVHLPVSKLWYQELLLLIWSAAEPVISAFILLGECPPPSPPRHSLIVLMLYLKANLFSVP